MGGYRAAAEIGLGVPAELSIVGYDNMHETAVGLFPGLTRLSYPIRDGRLGGAAAPRVDRSQSGTGKTRKAARPAGSPRVGTTPTRV